MIKNTNNHVFIYDIPNQEYIDASDYIKNLNYDPNQIYVLFYNDILQRQLQLLAPQASQTSQTPSAQQRRQDQDDL
jgi:hypothetical protein